jgi:hypothetical protein
MVVGSVLFQSDSRLDVGFTEEESDHARGQAGQ